MALHKTYAPILHFNKEEAFYPMRVDDYLAYCSLMERGDASPRIPAGQVTPERLVALGRSQTSYLRSVSRGPLEGQDVVSGWGKGALELAYRWAAGSPARLTEQLARKAYSWFNPRTARAAQQFWWNDLVRPALEGSLDSAEPGELPRLTLPLETQESALERYASRRPGYAYYYREVRDGDYLCLQYWFFYSYNNWGRRFGGMNDHEGDWEGMMLTFRLDAAGRPQEPPAYVTFADHESCQTKAWGHEDLTVVGTHPVGYVGAGSHATYPEKKVHALMELYELYDFANGDGLTIDHDDWVHRVSLDDVAWLGRYGGSWGTRFWLPTKQAQAMLRLLAGLGPLAGLAHLRLPPEFELPGVSAPRGPIDPRRPQYANPVAWAGIDAA